MAQLGGIARRLPRLAALMVFFTLASIGLPGLNGFVGEFLVLLGMFRRAFDAPPAAWAWQWQLIAVAATAGIVLGAWYMLWLVQRVFFGPLCEPDRGAHAAPHAAGTAASHRADDESVSSFAPADLSLRELCALAPLAVVILWIGLLPQRFIAPAQAALDQALQLPAARLAERWQPAGRDPHVAARVPAAAHEVAGHVD
jgi:NADH-quinone oxidoreductase subunit M